MPSQVVKDSTSTPIRGMTPKATNISRAGSAIQVSERSRMPLPPPADALLAGADCRAAGASAVTAR
ncbi:hypothetical protein GCM10009593_06570 [Microlunatus antarcticus]